jgi:hypothetical protein
VRHSNDGRKREEKRGRSNSQDLIPVRVFLYRRVTIFLRVVFKDVDISDDLKGLLIHKFGV